MKKLSEVDWQVLLRKANYGAHVACSWTLKTSRDVFNWLSFWANQGHVKLNRKLTVWDQDNKSDPVDAGDSDPSGPDFKSAEEFRQSLLKEQDAFYDLSIEEQLAQSKSSPSDSDVRHEDAPLHRYENTEEIPGKTSGPLETPEGSSTRVEVDLVKDDKDRKDE